MAKSTLILTFFQREKERSCKRPYIGRRQKSQRCFCRVRSAIILPLFEGEGWDEGQR